MPAPTGQSHPVGWMIEILVTSAGLLFGNAELLWIRSHDGADTVQLIAGGSMERVQQTPEEWLYFAMSECLEWHPESPSCLSSRIHVGMTSGVSYDLVAWSEAEDRTDPQREMVAVTEGWMFCSADVNMDREVGCADLDRYVSDPYDWDLDGEATAADLRALAAVTVAFRSDSNRDGAVDTADMGALLQQWGACPTGGMPCPADLNCDGTVAVEDLLLLLGAFGP